MTVNTVRVHFQCRSVNHLVHADTARGETRNGAVCVFFVTINNDIFSGRTAFTDCFVYWKLNVFTVRYEVNMNIYIYIYIIGTVFNHKKTVP